MEWVFEHHSVCYNLLNTPYVKCRYIKTCNAQLHRLLDKIMKLAMGTKNKNDLWDSRNAAVQ